MQSLGFGYFPKRSLGQVNGSGDEVVDIVVIVVVGIVVGIVVVGIVVGIVVVLTVVLTVVVTAIKRVSYSNNYNTKNAIFFQLKYKRIRPLCNQLWINQLIKIFVAVMHQHDNVNAV